MLIASYDGQVYWPKHGDIGKFLKVECTPIMGEIKYPPVFAISSRVSPGMFCSYFLVNGWLILDKLHVNLASKLLK